MIACIAVCIPVMLLSCKDTSRYYLKEQWYTSSSPYVPVKGKPASITEHLFFDIPAIDTTLSSGAKSSDKFVYDTAGNLLERKLSFSDYSGIEQIYQYSSKGYEITSANFSSSYPGQPQLWYIFEAGQAGKFRAVRHPDSADRRTLYYTYKDKGNTVIIEEEQPGVSIKEERSYDGQRILTIKREAISRLGKDNFSKKYFYGSNLILDSIVEKGEGACRTLFTSNQQGDPLTEIKIRADNNDTLSNYSYAYRYDRQKNWVRRLEANHLSQGKYGRTTSYSLIIRQINYR